MRSAVFDRRLGQSIEVMCLPSTVQAPQAQAAGAESFAAGPSGDTVERMGEAARKALARATSAVKRYGWVGFWCQVRLKAAAIISLPAL